MRFILILLAVALVSNVSAQFTKFENESCGTAPGWKCLRLRNCPSAQRDFKKGRKPEICSFIQLEPVVCCAPSEEGPPAQATTPQQTSTTRRATSKPNLGSKSKSMCTKYGEYVYELEWPPVLLSDVKPIKVDKCMQAAETLIVGGLEARVNEFPHMALIGFQDDPPQWRCGGSLISERFVVSAAHCSETQGLTANWVRLGEHQLSSTKDKTVHVDIRIAQRIVHPGYDQRLYDDIALFKLARNVELSPSIRPICLHTSHNIPGTDAVVSGWGHTRWNGRGSDVLMKVRLNLVDHSTCNASFASNIGTQIPQGILDSKMLCAGDEKGKDSCQGDSGGPLQIKLSNPYCTYSLIGVVSVGLECASGHPAIYTRISNYIPWIEKIVWP